MLPSAYTCIVNAYVSEYLGHLSVERGYSRHTIAAYGRDLGDYAAFLDGRGVADLAKATREDVTAFISALWNRGLAPSTVERRVAAVKGLHKFLVREGVTDNHPTARLPLPKVPERLPEVISIEDIDRFLGQPFADSPAGLRDRALLETLYGCGLRVSELTGLDLAGVDLGAGTCACSARGARSGSFRSPAWPHTLWTPTSGTVGPTSARRAPCEASTPRRCS